MKYSISAVLVVALAIANPGCGRSDGAKATPATQPASSDEPFKFERFALVYMEEFRGRLDRAYNKYEAGRIQVRLLPSEVVIKVDDSVPNGRMLMFTLCNYENGKATGKMAYQVVFCPDPTTRLWMIVRGTSYEFDSKSRNLLDVTSDDLLWDVFQANLWRDTDLSAK
jgi:hypothetical protein